MLWPGGSSAMERNLVAKYSTPMRRYLCEGSRDNILEQEGTRELDVAAGNLIRSWSVPSARRAQQ